VQTRLPQVLERIASIRATIGEFRAGESGQTAPVQRASFAKTLAAAQSGGRVTRFDAIISHAARVSGLDEDLIHAVVRAESGYDPRCRSSAGAMGLMQLMPGTASALGVADPWDPAQNVTGGARYLRQQLDRFGDLERALAAYNAGPGAVERYGGIPPYRETQAYVQRVLGYLQERREGPW